MLFPNWTQRARKNEHLKSIINLLKSIYIFEPKIDLFMNTFSGQMAECLWASKEFLDIQATIECGFTLKRIGHTIRTYRHSNWSLFLNKYSLVYSRHIV